MRLHTTRWGDVDGAAVLQQVFPRFKPLRLMASRSVFIDLVVIGGGDGRRGLQEQKNRARDAKRARFDFHRNSRST